MTLKPIRTHQDLSAAKRQIAQMIERNNDGQSADSIEVLATLIEQFERANIHLEAPNPIAAIKFRMEELGLSPRQLEPFIGSRARVSEVLSGKRSLSIDMIRSLHEGLRIPYESLMSERSTAKSGTSAATLDIESIPQHQPELTLSLSRTQIGSHALLRKTRTQRAAAKTDQHALMLWQSNVIKKSEQIVLPARFQRSLLRPDIFRQIARLSTKNQGPKKALEYLAGRGVSVVMLPPLPGTFLDGAAMLNPSGIPVIGITLRNDRIDSFWFTLLHELAHIYLHFDELSRDNSAFIDDMEIQSEEKHELEADELAQISLIPNSILAQVEWTESSTADELIAIATRARVHVSIVAGRWQRDHSNYRRFARMIERDTLRALLLP